MRYFLLLSFISIFSLCFSNNLYHVENQWGGSSAPWNDGGIWVIGGRSGQNVVAIHITSSDKGKTLNGTMTYMGEGSIGFKATLTQSNTYRVENQWGGSSTEWNPGGTWILGCRTDQNVVAIDVTSSDGGITLSGTITYAGEGTISFKSDLINGSVYTIENQWGGSFAPWSPGGTWVLGCRADQRIIAIHVTSSDDGKTLNGTMTYKGEGPIGFKATLTQSNTYRVENQWGGSSIEWNPGGTWILGCRTDQNVVAVNIASSDDGNTLNGNITYKGEGSIGFQGTLKETCRRRKRL